MNKIKKYFSWLLLILLASCTKQKEETLIIQEGQTNWQKKIVKAYPGGLMGVDLFSVCFKSQDTGFVAGVEYNPYWYPVFLRTTDGGETWSKIFVPVSVGASVVDIHFANANVGYAWVCSSDNQKLKTTDGGMTWAYTHTPFGSDETANSCFISSDKGFVASDGVIFCTTDGATSFTVYNKSFSGSYNYSDIDFPTTTTGYAATLNGVIIKSVDAGSTWDSIYRYPGKQFNAINFIDSLNGYLATNSGDILKTIDGGYTWDFLSTPTTSSDNITDVRFFGPSVGFASVNSLMAGPDSYKGKILKTTDGGVNWSVNYHSKIMAFNSLSVVNANYWFATGGTASYLSVPYNAYLLKTTTQGN